MKHSRLHRLADATSQWLNVLFWDGEANHSISGDAYRFKRVRLQRVIDWVFEQFGEHEHCLGSYLADLERAKKLVAEDQNVR
ncbi:MAG TPA: hypothetical protein VIC30_12645 [Orrella sp.]